MLPVAEKMNKIGFFSMEVWGGATFDVAIRYLNEDPWIRLNKLKEVLPDTPLQMLERSMSIVAYLTYPDDIVMKFIEFAKKNGCDRFRVFDALNDLRNMKIPIEAAKKVGGYTQGCLCFAISPVHTLESYVEKFKELEKMGCDSLCLKDMGGMMPPKSAYDIIKGCKDAGIKIPIDTHAHYTSGMAGMMYMRAIEAGASVVDTAMSPFSGGTALPPTEGVAAALKDTEWDTGYDLKELIEIRKLLIKVWDKYRHLHRMNALKFDPSVAVHQIPGGMLSNLIFQLEEQGIGDKFFEVLEETGRVREELGYPALATPTSQVVGIQAVMNVRFGRYKKVPKGTKDYCKGLYGQPPGEIKPEIMEAVLGKDWEDQVITCRPADLLEPLYKKRRDELEEMGLIKKEEDVITYALYPKVGLKFLKGELKPEFVSKDLPLPATHPLSKVLIKSIFPGLADEEIGGIGSRGPTAIPTEFDVEVDGEIFDIKLTPKGYEVAQPVAKKTVEGGVVAGMQGTILKIKAKKGDKVKEGDVVVLIEAMKMENEIVSPKSGIINDILVKEGEEVSPDSVVFAVSGK